MSPEVVKYTFIYEYVDFKGQTATYYHCQSTISIPTIEAIVGEIGYKCQPTLSEIVTNTLNPTQCFIERVLSIELKELLSSKATQLQIDNHTGYIFWICQHINRWDCDIFFLNLREQIQQYTELNPYIKERIEYIYTSIKAHQINQELRQLGISTPTTKNAEKSKADALELLTGGILKKKERLTSKLELIYKDYRLDIVELTEKPQYRKAALVTLVKEHFTKDYLNPNLLKNYKRLRILLCQYWNIKEPTIGEKQVRDYNNGTFINNIKSECNSLWGAK